MTGSRVVRCPRGARRGGGAHSRRSPVGDGAGSWTRHELHIQPDRDRRAAGRRREDQGFRGVEPSVFGRRRRPAAHPPDPDRPKHRLLDIDACVQHPPGPPFLTEAGPRTYRGSRRPLHYIPTRRCSRGSWATAVPRPANPTATSVDLRAARMGRSWEHRLRPPAVRHTRTVPPRPRGTGRERAFLRCWRR
jgi:hypothetical protein